MTFLPRAQKLIIDNSPHILTAVGVAGTISTTILGIRAGFRSAELLRAWEMTEDDAKAKVDVVWKEFVPPIVTGAITVAAILGANRISSSRAAGLAAAYSLSERAFDEYRNKTLEHLGTKKERIIRDEITQDQVNRTPGSREIIISGTDVRCFDAYSGRYFQGNMETIKAAQNKINYRILNDTYATLTDFYSEIGLERTQFSDEVGWSSMEQLELEFTTVLAEGVPCLAISFRTEPVRDYYKFH